MNEKTKKIVIVSIFLFFVFAIVIQSIANNRTIRQANTEIDRLERELETTRTRLEASEREVREGRAEIKDCRGTITECRTSIITIADRLDSDDGGLQEIIQNLRAIREEVFQMENSLNLYYSKYGNPNDSPGGDNDFLTEEN